MALRLRQHLTFKNDEIVTSMSPDGEYVCLRYQLSNNRRVARLRDNTVVYSITVSGFCGMYWSPNGKQLAITPNANVCVFDTESQSVAQLLSRSEYAPAQLNHTYIWDLQWSPNGKYIVVNVDTGFIFWEPAANTVFYTRFDILLNREPGSAPFYSAKSYQWLHNSKGIVLTGCGTVLCTNGSSKYHRSAALDDDTFTYRNISPSRDRMIFFSSINSQCKIYILKKQNNSQEKNIAVCTLGSSTHIRSITWSPSGERLAYLLRNDTDMQTCWVVCTKDGLRLRTANCVRGHFQGKCYWSPDERFVALADEVDGRTTIWSAEGTASPIGSVCMTCVRWMRQKKGCHASFHTMHKNSLYIYDIVRWAPSTHANFTDAAFRRNIFLLMLCYYCTHHSMCRMPYELLLEVFGYLALL